MATLDETVAAANASVTTWENLAQQFFSTLKSLAAQNISIQVPGGRSFNFTLDSGLRQAIDAKPPRPSGLGFINPIDPGALAPGTIRDPATISVPDFNIAAPKIDIPTRPKLDILSQPVAPTVRDVTIPTAPTVTLPTAPVLQNIEFPSAPTINIPTFTEAFPVDPKLLAPTNEFAYEENTVATPLLDAITAQLLSDIQNGGFGISNQEEQELWEREKDREAKAALAAEQEVLRVFASRGFSLPPGALAAAQDAARQAYQDRIAGAAREQALARAELKRRTREVAFGQGIQVDAELLKYHGFRLERAFNIARFTAEFSVQVFDAKVRQAQQELDRYKAFSEAYEAQVRAALARTEIFKAEIEAAALRVDADKTQVDIYQANIAASEAIVNLFRAQLEGTNLEAQIEAQKVEVFRSQVQAFVGQVQAQNAQMDLFRTAVQGEQAKSEIFTSQVDAFRNQVDASRIKAEIENRKTEIDIEKRKVALAEHQLKIEKFKADVEKEVQRVKSLVEVFEGDIDIYQAALGGFEQLANVGTAQIEAFIRARQEDTKLDQEQTRILLEGLIESAKVRFDAASAGATLATGIINAAQATKNAIISRDETV